jgi:hypothetical protein
MDQSRVAASKRSSRSATKARELPCRRRNKLLGDKAAVLPFAPRTNGNAAWGLLLKACRCGGARVGGVRRAAPVLPQLHDSAEGAFVATQLASVGVTRGDRLVLTDDCYPQACAVLVVRPRQLLLEK